MKAIMAAAIFFVVATTASAGPTKKTFAKSCDAVWAAEQTVLASGQYKNVVIDKEKRTASFADNSVVNLNTSLSGSADSCTVEVQEIAPPLSRGPKNAMNFLHRVENALGAEK